MRAAKVQVSLRICAVSPEPPLLAHRSSESRGTFRQKARSMAQLNGWACAVKICHDGMLEDTNSLDAPHMCLIHHNLLFFVTIHIFYCRYGILRWTIIIAGTYQTVILTFWHDYSQHRIWWKSKDSLPMYFKSWDVLFYPDLCVFNSQDGQVHCATRILMTFCFISAVVQYWYQSKRNLFCCIL